MSSMLSLAVLPSTGQHQSNFTQFYLNPYLLNASYAGLDGQPSISLIYRKQWMTIDGAPTITNLSLQAPVNTRVGAGVSVTNDSKGFFDNSTILFSAAYHVPVADHSFVRFGLSAGASWNTVDMEKLEAVSNDPAIATVLDNNASLAGNAGASFHHRTFNVGLALPAIFSPAYVSEDAFSVKEVKPFQALVFHATNRFYFNKNKNIFEPYLLYHVNTDLPSQIELAGIMHLNHMVWAGGSYKQYFGISALGGVKLKNSLAIGASYSIQQSGLDELNSPSFEISANYLFGAHKRNAPVYSFVNAVKPKEKTQTGPARQAVAAREKQAEAEQKRQDEAARLKAEREETRKRALAEAEIKKKQAQADAEARSKLNQQAADERKKAADEKLKAEQARKQQMAANEETSATEEKKNLVAATDNNTQPRPDQNQAEETEARPIEPPQVAAIEPAVEEPITGNEGQDKVRSGGQQPIGAPQNVPEGHPQHEAEQLQRLQSASQDVARVVEQDRSAPVRHEIVKRGSHAQELDASEYVIVGVFKSAANAEHFSNGLRSLNFSTRYGHLTPKDLWYVYILKTTDLQRARAEQTRLSKLFLLRDAWLLTVEP